MKWKIEWNNVEECLPTQSGVYLTLKLYDNSEPFVAEYHYSAKFKKFNVRDDSESDDMAIDVHFWAKKPSVIL